MPSPPVKPYATCPFCTTEIKRGEEIDFYLLPDETTMVGHTGCVFVAQLFALYIHDDAEWARRRANP